MTKINSVADPSKVCFSNCSGLNVYKARVKWTVRLAITREDPKCSDPAPYSAQHSTDIDEALSVTSHARTKICFKLLGFGGEHDIR